jgi:hypothetical protein
MDQRLYQKTREIAEPEAYENYVKQKVRACVLARRRHRH